MNSDKSGFKYLFENLKFSKFWDILDKHIYRLFEIELDKRSFSVNYSIKTMSLLDKHIYEINEKTPNFGIMLEE